MLLSDRDIRRALDQRRIQFDPEIVDEQAFGACSIDCRLGPVFLVPREPITADIDGHDRLPVWERVEIGPGQAFRLPPGGFALAATLETLTLDDALAARLEGRSSFARLGIMVHSTAAVFEPGWTGTATLELSNVGPWAVRLTPGARICSFTFEPLSSPAMTPYLRKNGAKYVGQRLPQPGRLEGNIE